MTYLSKAFIAISLLTSSMSMANAATTVDLEFAAYQMVGAGPFSTEAGEKLWNQKHADGRSCAGCHGSDLRQVGKHVNTGKKIEPLAPSVNPKRLTDQRQIEKWFTRNCKWTLGRECTAQEKGDFLTFILAQ